MFSIFLLIFCLLIIYYKLISPYNYWKNKGASYIKPWPLFGNIGPYVLKRFNFVDLLNNLYYANPEKRYDGIYQFLKPTLLIRDPELIKQILIKDFDTFSEQPGISSENEKLGNKTLSFLTKENGWQDMRSILSRTFTSSKMRMLFTVMEESADQLTNHLLKLKEDTITADVSDMFTRITNDVITSSTIGIQSDSLNDKNNEFYLQSQKIINKTGFDTLIFVISALPKIVQNLLGTRFINNDSEEFFERIIQETIKYREDNNVIRHDMLHLLMEAKKDRIKQDEEDEVDSGFAAVKESPLTAPKKVKAKLTDEDIAAQAISFYIAGFLPTTIALCHLSYELAIHPDIQQKLQLEISKTMEKCDGKITYEALLKMKYLDCVVSESLRIRGVGVNISRRSSKAFTIEPKLPGEVPVHLEKGSVIWIPVWSIHLDPKYYANPDKFDPERFNDDNKHLINPQTYMPFGGGPRNCIGSRFALLQIKIIIVKLLHAFDIVPVEKTLIPLKCKPEDVFLIPNTGLWLGLNRRN